MSDHDMHIFQDEMKQEFLDDLAMNMQADSDFIDGVPQLLANQAVENEILEDFGY